MVSPTSAPTDAAAWRPAARLDELQPDAPVSRQIGSKNLVLVRHAGAVFALDAVCPHKQGNLAEGKIVLDELACPLHGFRYCLGDGKAAVPSAVPGVRSYPVRIEGEDVLVDVRRPLRAPST